MKKFLKVSGFIVLANFIISTLFIGYFTFSILNNSLKSADVSVMDLNKLSSEKKSQINDYIKINAAKAGTDCAKNFLAASYVLFPSSKITTEYKYVDFDSIPSQYNDQSQQINNAADQGVKEGLEYLKLSNPNK